MSKRKVLTRLLAVIFVVLVIFSVNFIQRQYVVPILMYHSVNPAARPENRLAVKTDSFDRQMAFLKRHKYNVISLEAFADLSRQGKKVPKNTVVLTFDDGYKDNYIYAFPILKKYNFPATIFVIINEIGRMQNDRLNWQEIKAMGACGIITIGSHTLSHPFLPDIREVQAREEIFLSKKILEEKLGTKINTFCYPSGRFNARIENMVRDAGYKVAVATRPGRNFSNNDNFALKRQRISATADNLFVFLIQVSGYYNVMREATHGK